MYVNNAMEKKTPRSEFRSEVREKRLAYYGVSSPTTKAKLEKSIQGEGKNGELTSSRTPNKNGQKNKPAVAKQNAVKQNQETFEKNMNNDRKVNCLNLDSVHEELLTARTLDTSRTSEILMETARDFREVLKTRETLRSKQSSKNSANVKSNSDRETIAQSDDLTNRSVSDVLKILEERASHRRRELPRLSDFSESDEEVIDPDPTSAERMEKNDNFYQDADEWSKKFQFLCQNDERQSNYSSGLDKNSASEDRPRGSLAVASLDSSLHFGASFKKDIHLGDAFEINQELMEQEREIELQHSSILRKILANTEICNGNSATQKSVNGDVKRSENSNLYPNKPQAFTTTAMRANVAFSADEIISQAELYSSKGFPHEVLLSKADNPMFASVNLESHNDQSQLPMKRSVHFNCPPTLSDNEPSRKDPPSSGLCSSAETKSSASVVSLMSIRDISDRLEQLGINPHLLGIELTSGQNKHADDKTKRRNKIRRLVRICPECGKYNSEAVSWCLACSGVLIGIEPQPFPRRRHRGNRNRNSASLSNSFDSSKESIKSSVELDSSNGSSILEQSRRDIEELHSVVSDVVSVCQNGVSNHQEVDGMRTGDSRKNYSDVSRSKEMLPSSIYKDDVSNIVTPLMTTEREAVVTPSAVWNPKEVNIAEIVKQSRALLDEHENPREDGERDPLLEPSRSADIPCHSRSPEVNNCWPMLMSTDSTLSSVSLTTPSPNRPSVPNTIQEDLRLNLTSSSLEESQSSPLKMCAVDIAVLDRQDVIAMRENSAASQKPEAVPGLSLGLSPSSSFIGDRLQGTSPEEMALEEISFQEPYNEMIPEDPSERTFQFLSENKLFDKQKLQQESKRRPGTASALSGPHRANRSNINHTQRPMSSSQQPLYRRRWKNSSQAWSSHHPSQLKKKPANYLVKESINASKSKDKIQVDKVSYMQRNGEVLKQRNTNSCDPLSASSTECNGYQDPKIYEYGNKTDHILSERDLVPQHHSVQLVEDNANYVMENGRDVEPLALHDDSLAFLHQRGWQFSKDSPWLYLADEVWLLIFKFLSPKDLSNCSATCKRLHRVANDSSLWRNPVVKRKHDISEDELLTIGARRPISLKLKQCKGQNISLQGLKSFFALCAGSLRKLSFSGCNHGAFSEDQFILLAAMFCPQLTSVDISFAHGVRDSTVRALAEECERLECVMLNGGQNVTDSSVKFLVETHGGSLRKLELYCCFGVSSESARLLGKCCSKLTHVSFGSCNRISSNALIYFASHRRENLKSLDLRGMHSVLDSTVIAIVAVCPNLESLTLSNCGSVSNSSIRAIANHCSRLRTLDVCGCNQVGSDSAQELVRKCKHLEELDFSSTCVDHKTVTCLAHTRPIKLRCLRLNFCCNLKEDGLFKLCANSKSLSTLYLYGIRNFGVSVFNRIRKEYPKLDVKSDDSLEPVDT